MTKTKTIKIQDLSYYYKNPRKGDIEAIANSLKTHGQYKTICVNKGTKTGRPLEILAGNHTIKAARTLGWETIQATIIDVDDEAAAKIVIADNRTSDLAENDPAILIDLIDSLTDLDGTGWAETELEELAETINRLDYTPEILNDPDETPQPPATPKTKQGDIIALGDSLLYVGDATDTENVLKAFGQRRANCIWTDPPYGVDYVGKTKDALTIKNDTASNLETLLTGAYATIIKASLPGAPFYISYPPGVNGLLFQNAAKQTGLIIRQILVWAKQRFIFGHSDYHYQHELILYGFTPGGNGRLGRGGNRWYGDNTQSTVFEFDAPQRNPDHPTMKPVALIQAMIKNSCPPGGTILDCFAGSGSTLIAAYGLGMSALLVEYDPLYADVICRRWQEHTGIKPINQTTGESYDFTTQEEQDE